MNVIDQPAANDPAADPSPAWQKEMRRALRAGICGTVLGVVALSAWAALAPLAAAVIAEGTVKSVGNRKTVQHAEGGIVAAIHVKDGDRVKQGQPLMTLADARGRGRSVPARTVDRQQPEGAALERRDARCCLRARPPRA
jgi:multidrug efflux pump subunit AcrA (membrane-fusion protein)